MALMGLPMVMVGASGPTTLLSDTFTDTNGVSLDAHMMDVGAGWTLVAAAVVEVQSNRAEVQNSNEGIAHADAGQADVTMTATINLGTSGTTGLSARLLNQQNYWLIGISTSNAFSIFERSGGTYTSRASSAPSISAGVDYAMSAVTLGSTISATLDGGNDINYASASFLQAETDFGLSLRSINDKADTFLVTA